MSVDCKTKVIVTMMICKKSARNFEMRKSDVFPDFKAQQVMLPQQPAKQDPKHPTSILETRQSQGTKKIDWVVNFCNALG
jgi:hypothetical protein